MATKLYLGQDASVVYTPGSFKGTWDTTTSAVVMRLHTSRLGASASVQLSDTVATNPYRRVLYQGVSDPLSANTTISGTVTGVLLGRETDVAANMTLKLHIWVTVGDSSTVRGTLLSNFVDTTEWQADASFHGAITINQALSSVSALAGDRIVVEAGFSAANAVTTGYTGALLYGGDQTDATGSETTANTTAAIAPWLNFSTTLAFTPTYLYSTEDPAPTTPPAYRGTWTDATLGVDRYLSTTKSGANTIIQVNEGLSSQPLDYLLTRYVTDVIAAQTISGSLQVMLKMMESNSLADNFPKLHAYVMKSDGTVRGTLVSDTVGASELSALNVKLYTYTMSSVSAQNGDYIVIEAGFRSTNTSTTSFGSHIYNGGTNADASANILSSDADMSGWIRFPNGLTFYSAPPSTATPVLISDPRTEQSFKVKWPIIETSVACGDATILPAVRVGTLSVGE